MKFNQTYHRESFENLLSSTLFGDKYKKDYKSINIDRKTIFFDEKSCFILGKVNLDRDIYILEIKQKSKKDPRITLTKDAFKIMEDIGANYALVIFYSDDSKSYRLSLLTRKKFFGEKEESDPKRYSFLLGEGEKTKTPEKQLNKQINNFEELFNSFDVEVVRKEFFNNYLDLYIRLYREVIKDIDFIKLLKSQGVDLVSFTKTLLGKIVFLYFIQKKGWLGVKRGGDYGIDGDKDFMRSIWNDFKNNSESLTIEKKGYFYNDYLEWLFYEGLNKDRRDNEDYFVNLQMKVPYLNGGLFKEDYKDWEKNVSKISNDIFSNTDKTGILDIFDTYNFTVDEDDLYDKEVAVDPEMLGKIFEKMISISSENIDDILEEYNKNESSGKKKKLEIDNVLNKKLGAFYTPREIVHYMTKESLIAYLVNNLKGKKEENEEKIRKLFEFKEQFLVSKQEITEEIFDKLANIITEVDELLKKVKVLDPAIGSGAFPMGLLHEISSIRYYIYGVFYETFGMNTADFKNESGKVSMYKIKRDVIQNNIYGVDISAGAIDIARLRFWLSLVVDEEKPEPLPNFEFKFVCANTLIPLIDEKGIFDNINEEKLREKVNKWYNTQSNKENNNDEGKDKIRKSIEEILQKGHSNIFASEKEKQLTTFNPFESKTNAEFFDLNLMFGFRRGEKLDILIGNPPYVRHEEIKELKPLLEKSYKTYSGTSDLYCYFYEKGFDLLKQGGFLSYITSNKFLKAKYGENIRNLFKNETIIRDLVDFGGYKVFDNATVDSIIFQFEKGYKISNSFGVLEVKEKFSDLKSYFDKEKFEVKQEKLSNNSWTLGNNTIIELKEKIENQGIKLKDYCGEPKVGVKTGYNEAYIFDKFEVDKITKGNEKEKKLFRKFIKGKDLFRYSILESNNFILFPYIEENGIFKVIDIDDFPNIKKFLLENKEKLENRSDLKGKNLKWYEFRSCSYYNSFFTNKIVYPDIGSGPSFYYDENKSIVEMTGFIIPNGNKYLLSLLNSSLIGKFFFKLICTDLAGKGFRFKNQFINNLPIRQISQESQKPFIEKVDQILKITKQPFYNPKNPPKEQKDLENEIDKMVYELYGLSEEEVRVVEESLV